MQVVCANVTPVCAYVTPVPADGGKLLCNVGQLPEQCLIYSLGSNGDYSFEVDMLTNTK